MTAVRRFAVRVALSLAVALLGGASVARGQIAERWILYGFYVDDAGDDRRRLVWHRYEEATHRCRVCEALAGHAQPFASITSVREGTPI